MYLPRAKCSCYELKLVKTSAYFLRFDIKLKKSRSGFDLVMVLISKQSFFQHRVWPVKQGKSYLHEIALPDFYIVISFFHIKSKQARVPGKVPDVTKEQIYVYAISR